MFLLKNRIERVNKPLGFKKSISRSYLLFIFLGTIMLFSPLTTKDGMNISVIDSLFMATSAFSDTGLSVVSSIEYFNFFGQLVILFLIQAGGTGIMALKVMIFIAIRKKINMSDRMLISTEQNQNGVGGMVKLIKYSLMVIFSFQLFFTCLLTIHMLIFYNMEFLESLWFSFFHTISAINNAGFDITGNSFLDYSTDYLLQIYILILVIIGGIGFPVIMDVKLFLEHRKRKESFRFSLFTKISVATYFIVTLIGLIAVLVIDRQFLLIDTNPIEGIFYALFQVISTRNAGFATIDLNEFSRASQLVFSSLMFIGAAPASTGGGIRTTTFAVIILFLLATSQNKKDINIFNRRLPEKTVLNAFITFSVAVFLVLIAIIIIVALEDDVLHIAIMFEVISAFGTTGLSLGVTSSLGSISKLVLIIVMIVGQIGIGSTLVMFTSSLNDESEIRFPEENITIG